MGHWSSGPSEETASQLPFRTRFCGSEAGTWETSVLVHEGRAAPVKGTAVSHLLLPHLSLPLLLLWETFASLKQPANLEI